LHFNSGDNLNPKRGSLLAAQRRGKRGAKGDLKQRKKKKKKKKKKQKWVEKLNQVT